MLLVLSAAAAFAEPLEVAVLPAKIVPEQATTLMLEAGVLSDVADESQHLERGAVIAVLNRERTEQEREEMELQIARDSLSTKDEIRKLESQRSKVKFYLSLSDKERAYAQSPAAEDELPPTQESLRDIDERLSLHRRRLESLPRVKRNEFARTHDKLTLRMPFSGRLQYNVSLPEDRSTPFEFVPTPSLPFATVCDDSAFYITVSIARAELTQLPPERFSVSISLPEGKRLVGTYDHRRVEHGGNSDMLVYFFRLPKEEHETALSMLGTNAQARLVFDADPGTITVNKAELIMKPEAAECADWEELIARLYPHHHIVIVGERSIILREHP
ncbi:MAG: hypothetical protein MJ051_05300 [Akkermansia sp.]|nr:hypothetical protein [Akkermansia sp.]